MTDQNHGGFPPPPGEESPQPTQRIDARQVAAAAEQKATEAESANPWGQPQGDAQGTPAPAAQQPWEQNQQAPGQAWDQNQQAPQQPWDQNQQAPVQPYGQPSFGQPAAYGATPAGTPAKPGPLRWIILGLLGLSALLGIIGTFGPWIDLKVSHPLVGNLETAVNGIGSQSGSEQLEGKNDGATDGWFVLIPAILALGAMAMLFLRKYARIAGIIAIVLSLVVLGVTLYDIADINDEVGKLRDQAGASGMNVEGGTGWGIWMSLVSGLLMLGGGVLALLRGHKA